MLYYKDNNEPFDKKVEGYVFYVLLLENGWLYKGYTSKFHNRMNAQFSPYGGCATTRKHKPVSIFYYEEYENKKDATMRELQMKQPNSNSIIKELAKNFRQIGVTYEQYNHNIKNV